MLGKAISRGGRHECFARAHSDLLASRSEHQGITPFSVGNSGQAVLCAKVGLFVETRSLAEVVVELEPGHPIRPESVTQCLSGMSGIGDWVDARAADRQQIRQRVEVDGERGPAIFASISMHLVGAAESLQIPTLGPSKARLWKDGERDERCALEPPANGAVAVMSVYRGLGNRELVRAAKT